MFSSILFFHVTTVVPTLINRKDVNENKDKHSKRHVSSRPLYQVKRSIENWFIQKGLTVIQSYEQIIELFPFLIFIE